MPPLNFTALLSVAGIIPLAMLTYYRVWPFLRNHPPVDWVYCIPFLALGGVVFGAAVGIYLRPLSVFIVYTGSQALILVILAEFATVLAVTQLMSADAARCDDGKTHP